MASAALHIKDAYYFEVPKPLWRSDRESIQDFPRFWVRNDADFQNWEAKRLHEHLQKITNDAPEQAELLDDWHHWQHASHRNYAKPLDVYLESHAAKDRAAYKKWASKPKNADRGFPEFLRETNSEFAWFSKNTNDKKFLSDWDRAKRQTGDNDAVDEFKAEHQWSEAKVDEYNSLLHGKILIPQPFGELRNLYQVESGFGVSKFMLIEVVVALIVVALFTGLARRVQSGEPPKGRLWNLLETFLIFIRDEIATPTMGAKDAAKYTPLLWTIFMFILGCNLMGMLPWAGARPTGSFSVTLALAVVTMGTGMVFGMKKFGFAGFWLNLIPSMDLPWWISPIIKPLMFAIELLGFMIKHGVLAIRLLANMVAGHLVLLGIMGLAFTYEAAQSSSWEVAAFVAIIGATLFSCLELFVAFLQAYLFTFLSSLFIAASTHHH